MEIKLCPYCKEEIKVEAIKCKHCGEFINKPVETIINHNVEPVVELEIPDTWNRFGWMIASSRWIIWISLILPLKFLFFSDSQNSVKWFSFLTSIIGIVSVYFIYMLVKYVSNFKEKFLVINIYLWIYLAITVIGLFISIYELTIDSIITDDIDSDTATAIGVGVILLFALYLFCQFIVGYTLMKLKNDCVGGLNTIGTIFFVFPFLYIIGFLLSTFDSIIIYSLISLVFSALIMLNMDKVLENADSYNFEIKKSQVSTNE